MTTVEADFTELVASAYQQLYDLVSLRTHPLTRYLCADPALNPKKRGWELHHILLEVIKELDPGPQAPAFSREWRRHRLMVMRYVEAQDPQSVASRLAISRRQYYREHKAAIEAVAGMLRARHLASRRQPAEAAAQGEQSRPDSLELLRLEASRISQNSRLTDLADVLQGVLALLHKLLQGNQLAVRQKLPEGLPAIAMDRNLLRQMLLGILGYLVEHTARAALVLTAQADGTAVHLSVEVEPKTALARASHAEVAQRLATFYEMAALNGARIVPLGPEHAVVGLRADLPTAPQRTVLVVDDNEDVLTLYKHYLVPHRYRVLLAQTAEEALDLACQQRPDAITLDLMMPDQDGWDLLQTLRNHPATHHIPIIVCSVLKQSELALALGATAFLEKPITEQDLLSALKALEAG